MNQGPLNVESRKKEHLNHGNEREGIEESGDSIGNDDDDDDIKEQRYVIYPTAIYQTDTSHQQTLTN